MSGGLPRPAQTALRSLRRGARGTLALARGGRPPDRLILHVGLHKTGTTSLQAALELWRWRLLLSGVRPVRRRGPAYMAMRRAITPLAHTESRSLARRREARDAIAAFLETQRVPGAHTLLLSHEDLIGSPLLTAHGRAYGDAGARLDLLREATAGYARVELVLTLRAQDALLESLVLHLTKAGRVDDPAALLDRCADAAPSLAGLVAAAEGRFGPGRVHVLPVEASGGDPVWLPTRVLAIAAPGIRPPGRLPDGALAYNPTLTETGIRMAIGVRRSGALKPGREWRAFRDHLERHHSARTGPRAQLLTPELSRRILAPHAAHNAALLARCGYGELAPRYAPSP